MFNDYKDEFELKCFYVKKNSMDRGNGYSHKILIFLSLKLISNFDLVQFKFKKILYLRRLIKFKSYRV